MSEKFLSEDLNKLCGLRTPTLAIVMGHFVSYKKPIIYITYIYVNVLCAYMHTLRNKEAVSIISSCLVFWS